ncbi:MAG: ATP-grasp domain-containing protein [Planctomycetota bacterium]
MSPGHPPKVFIQLRSYSTNGDPKQPALKAANLVPMLRIGILTGVVHPGLNYASEHRLTQALADRDAIVTWLRWDAAEAGEGRGDVAAGIDWSQFDAVLIRTTWDYVRVGEQQYIDRLRAIGKQTRLFNNAETVERNIDKSYLRMLADAGAPIIETLWLDRETLDSIDLVAILRDRGWRDVILKPVVGAAASGLLRFRTDDPAQVAKAEQHVREDLLSRYPMVLAQPFLPSVVTRGEISLMYFDGAFSHAVQKVPKAGDIRVQLEYGATHTVYSPSDAELQAADAVVQAWPGDLLYARVDLVDAAPTTAEDAPPADPRLMELELIEPELFMHQAAVAHVDAAGRLAEGLLRRLR